MCHTFAIHRIEFGRDRVEFGCCPLACWRGDGDAAAKEIELALGIGRQRRDRLILRRFCGEPHLQFGAISPDLGRDTIAIDGDIGVVDPLHLRVENAELGELLFSLGDERIGISGSRCALRKCRGSERKRQRCGGEFECHECNLSAMF